MRKEALTVTGLEASEAVSEGELQVAEGASGGLAQVGLEFGESHLDGV